MEPAILVKSLTDSETNVEGLDPSRALTGWSCEIESAVAVGGSSGYTDLVIGVISIAPQLAQQRRVPRVYAVPGSNIVVPLRAEKTIAIQSA